eukprot:3905594-Prymnesium_polylepis.1
MGARNRSSFPAAARCGFRATVLLGATSRARTGMAVVGRVRWSWGLSHVDFQIYFHCTRFIRAVK